MLEKYKSRFLESVTGEFKTITKLESGFTTEMESETLSVLTQELGQYSPDIVKSIETRLIAKF